GGVGEYWIFDPRRKAALFYRLDQHGVYTSQITDEAGNYHSPRLPKFKVNVPVLWEDELPNFFAIASTIQGMLKS
ncbi:MAG: Uma2 family endonuclease, partial [Chitinophagaceae bacterium]|nr:Uma2 family endonuclease [Anaerolineae bacterium]